MISDELRDELRQRCEERGWRFHIEVSEADALDLASGFVPNAVKAMVLTMLDFQRQDELRAARPMRNKAKVSQK